ncbi:ankyrin repeat domain-containing protein 10a [Myripristis murdjan]|uniref:Ankyrin repeat domain 10a n=1 Tax=Myripristis murdjan TaxID=586833 RepID=A0A667WQQ9_9TELE|nr:ankyrin repeat domain-containing protein 10-like [Myripristis murdjan]
MSVGVESGFSSDEVLTNGFPVHRACRDGDVGALVLLLQHVSNQAHLTAEDSCYGWTPKHWAAHYGQLECVVRLVQMGCEVNTTTSRFNQTATHIAAFGGHPQCVVWLLQAGADVNRQDYVGETPIHKAARSGSLNCIQVLLLGGAKPHLKNASGQTAADLAHAQGFQECFQLLSNTQNHHLQLNGLHANGALNGNSAPCGQGLLSGVANRKRLLDDVESAHTKKARTDSVDVALWLQNGGGEELESMNVESAHDLNSDDDTMSGRHIVPTDTTTNGYHHVLPRADPGNTDPRKSLSEKWAPSTENILSSQTANQEAAEGPGQRRSADMCGSLHLTGSPSSCISHRPAWGLLAADCGDSLHYGHYHGFGDTAEDLTDTSSRLEHSRSVGVEQRYNEAVVSAVQLYHGS